jgi:hypothetical protein
MLAYALLCLSTLVVFVIILAVPAYVYSVLIQYLYPMHNDQIACSLSLSKNCSHIHGMNVLHE